MKKKRQSQYEDIIHIPYPFPSRHKKMPNRKRAAQFSPFAALTGYDAIIKETARYTERKPELSEEEKAQLDYKLQMALALPEEPVFITYFVPDQSKAGGALHTAAGRIMRIDPVGRRLLLEEGPQIDLSCILDIAGAFPPFWSE